MLLVQQHLVCIVKVINDNKLCVEGNKDESDKYLLLFIIGRHVIVRPGLLVAGEEIK